MSDVPDEVVVDEVIEMTEPELLKLVPDNVIDFPGARTASADDNTKRIGDLEIPLPLYNIYLAETDELVRVLAQDFGEWRHETERAVSPEAIKAAHTLAKHLGHRGLPAP
ncbi:hypothetical protein LP420_26080 [Massilia sp. B-10]|nr:hypothetical protein LP420_26080 [Massilia sp. B-10]